VADQVSDPPGDHTRLARSGPSQHQKWPFGMQDRLLLLGIQIG
jgi:hypothetical protein